LFSGWVSVGTTETVPWSIRVTFPVRSGFFMIPIEVRYHCAVLRLSVPHQSTVPFAYAS
jgi:hypothetical protein